MNGRSSPPGKWEKFLGPEFTKTLDSFLAEKRKEASTEQNVTEQPEKTPQQILAEMGLAGTTVEPPQNHTAIAGPEPNFPRSIHSMPPDQTTCKPTERVTTLVGSGVRMVHPVIAGPGPGHRDTSKKQLQRPGRKFGVRQALVGMAAICLLVAVAWRAAQNRTAGPERLASTITPAAGSNSDLAAEPSSTTTPGVNLAPAATSSASSKIAARIFFAFNSSELDSKSKMTLRGVMEQVLTAKDPAIEIHGYSDPVGDAAYNQFLSEERAGAVRKYLTHSGTLKDVSIKIIGHGSDASVTSDSNVDAFSNPEARENSRRVEVVLYGSARNSGGN